MSRAFAQFKSFLLGGLRKAQHRISLRKLAVFLAGQQWPAKHLSVPAPYSRRPIFVRDRSPPIA
jgi:hypothetical protein